jgi:hypothetical protein
MEVCSQSREIVLRPHLQNNQSNMDWKYGSSKALSSNSNPTQKKKVLLPQKRKCGTYIQCLIFRHKEE